MEYKQFIRKLKNIKKQHNAEEALTPIIYQLLDREDVSLMVVQTSRGKKGYYGISSNPDLVILDNNFKYEEDIDKFNFEKVYGCVELKKMEETLIDSTNNSDIVSSVLKRIQELTANTNNDEYLQGLDVKINDIGQLLGEILWYRKVLYTNGCNWVVYSLNFVDGYEESQYIAEIKEFANDERKSNKEWFSRLSKEEWIKRISIKKTVILNSKKIDNITETDFNTLKQELTNQLLP